MDSSPVHTWHKNVPGLTTCDRNSLHRTIIKLKPTTLWFAKILCPAGLKQQCKQSHAHSIAINTKKKNKSKTQTEFIPWQTKSAKIFDALVWRYHTLFDDLDLLKCFPYTLLKACGMIVEKCNLAVSPFWATVETWRCKMAAPWKRTCTLFRLILW